ncbi:hypothetical protein K2173_011065 [Erythroxylum novogranatense]|uniref:Coenzyme Q-binding protein COQ10 START domain-containing protein n=1 Tax=Erythroxylum novogranatense TaxID=1862640 RepID=A0AAV8S4S1_9ROSI|nr:hypothetical protein K2173_011065 [Erythroxylum novogranatense]
MYYPQQGDIMRAFAVLLHDYPSSYLCRPIIISADSQHLRPKSVNFVAHSASFATSVNYLRSRPRPHCSTADSSDLGDDNSDDHDSADSVQRDGVITEIEKLGNNTRRIRSRIAIDANLETIWSILTDYERLSDFIPSLALSKLIEKSDNVVRLYQIGTQNLPLGLKFNAKAVLDCYEKDVEICEFGKRRDIEFKMTEGDFHLFQGKWSIEQLDKPGLKNPITPLIKNFRQFFGILWM